MTSSRSVLGCEGGRQIWRRSVHHDLIFPNRPASVSSYFLRISDFKKFPQNYWSYSSRICEHSFCSSQWFYSLKLHLYLTFTLKFIRFTDSGFVLGFFGSTFYSGSKFFAQYFKDHHKEDIIGAAIQSEINNLWLNVVTAVRSLRAFNIQKQIFGGLLL